MKRYLVKQISVATEQNPNFAGQVSVSFYGKGDEPIGHTGTHAEAVHDYAEPNHYSIKEYGYSRKRDALRNWTYRHPENTKFWNSTVEIIEVEI